ncbi:amino acid ABC transporter permease [Micromonospora sp. DR5-3]|uniref:amino acid ABC transporter permease n=1 Tax=unclassified Micromonospora TaxID=2617518 RepID=UPI001CA36250|nr:MULTISPECIES: amino acid ABC transporter permease [unclassified Micromonospora]MCW3818964.1 amino acid ABC transporter permease [Micromonospora sp. DR5-3]
MNRPVEPAVEAELLTLPRKRYGELAGALAVLAVLAWLAMSLANAAIDWGVVRDHLTVDVLLRGLGTTIILTIVAMVLGVILGVVVAVMRLSHSPVTSTVGWLYVWVFRGTPVYLQLLAWFNIALIFPYLQIPGIWGARTVDVVTPFVAAAIGLGLNQGAYTSEVVRAGILSVDEGQTEAAYAIGMTRLRTMRRIVLPQAMRVILPPIGNETIGMLKTTSLASAIGVSEILSEAQHIYFVNNRIMELLIVCAVWYLAAVSLLSVVQFYLERHFAKGSSSRSLPDTPVQRLRKAITSGKQARR